MDFIAFDVETANAALASICAIGLVGFEGGQPTRPLRFLVNPEDHFDPFNVSIHGITEEAVADAPTIKQVFPSLSASLAGKIVVHPTPFDRVAIARAALKAGFQPPHCRWLDSSRVARRAWPPFARRGYGLANLCIEKGISLPRAGGMHDALEDAEAAGRLVLRALADTNLQLADWLIRAAQPLFPDQGRVARSGSPEGPLNGDLVVFTGRLEIPRREAADIAASLGCDVADRVTKETTLLIVGEQDIRVLAGHDKSSKHRRAEQLIAAGQMLWILGEGDFKLLTAILTP